MERRISHAVLGVLLAFAGCDFIAVQSAPEKTADASATELSQKARDTFWAALHGGRYEQLPEALRLLTAAYLQNPRNPETSLLLAHAHLWKIAERSREPEPDPRITDHAVLAEKYFTEARRLNPTDHRIPGWLGGVKLALGQIHQDERLTREGYVMLHDSIALFPEFNYFSAGYVLGSRPADDAKFREAVDDMWRSLDLCAGEKIDRTDPDYRRFMATATTTGPRRVCWNGWIAPHNFEGFFLNMGDLLVKQGRVEQAKKIYQTAKLSKDYGSWKYQAVLEARLAQAEERARQFQAADPKQHPEIMFNSAHACAACHAR
ncbi:MAG: hypothetical protein EPO02_08395 [Nitrospirae bacterium]|nr:MAG: hypothetical protein EPO02_08395 [Nitrospirota bacterium]